MAWRSTGHAMKHDWKDEDNDVHKGVCLCGQPFTGKDYTDIKNKLADHRGTETAAGKQKPPD